MHSLISSTSQGGLDLNVTIKGEEPINLVKKENPPFDVKTNHDTSKTLQTDQKSSIYQEYLLSFADLFSNFGKNTTDLTIPATTNKITQVATKRNRLSSHGRHGNEYDQEMESCFVTRWTETPCFVNGEMKDYQIVGLNWLIRLHDNGINGILADEMGLGKTLQTLSFLCYLKQVRSISGPHLVIVPKSTMTNWLNEFRHWVPSMNVFAYHGNKQERKVLRETNLQQGKFDAVVTTYEMVTTEKSTFKNFEWSYLIIDEAHRIKNEKSVLSQVVRLYKSKNRLLITGTPLQNNLHELWSLLNFLLPELFASSEYFDSWLHLKDQTQGQQEVVDRLHKILRPFLLRRIKSEVAKGLPPKVETKLYIPMSAMQKEWYQKILLKDIDSINTTIGKGNRPRFLNILMQLRKVCNHPYLFSGAEPTDLSREEESHQLLQNSGKMILLDKILQRLKEQNSRVLIFSQMSRMLDILEDYIIMTGYEYCRIDGQTCSLSRQTQIDVFNAQDSTKFCFLLSTRAGGLGINLATADTVILFDSDWNPQVDLQAQDRAHRIGQTKLVNVYRFVTEGTVEEKIIERAEVKLKIDAMVIQQGRLFDQQKMLSKEEMLKMIKFGADRIFSSKDSDITDEDIDMILGKGQKKTAEFNAKMKTMERSMMDLLVLNDDTTFDMWTFEGESYKTNHPINGFSFQTSKRKRKSLQYNERAYFRSVLHSGGPTKARKITGLKPPKQPTIYPHQFCSPKLLTIYDKEMALFGKNLEEYERRIKEKLDVSDIENFYNQPKQANTINNTHGNGLTGADSVNYQSFEEEKQALLEQSFRDWSKRDFFAFLRGCEKFGRSNYAKIREEIETKSLADVIKYSKTFWKRYKEIPQIESRIQQIERGHRRIDRQNAMVQALDMKMAMARQSNGKFKFVYPPSQNKVYTEEEDIFLITATHKVGYGNWEALKKEILLSRAFRFNWFLKTRSPLQFQHRVNSLIRLIEKEFAANLPLSKSFSKSTSSGRRRAIGESNDSDPDLDNEHNDQAQPSDGNNQASDPEESDEENLDNEYSGEENYPVEDAEEEVQVSEENEIEEIEDSE